MTSKNPKASTPAEENAKTAAPAPIDENPKTHPTSNAVKDPHDWTTGDQPMTGAQASYLKTLSEEAHEVFDGELSKADASLKIDELQETTGRGK